MKTREPPGADKIVSHCTIPVGSLATLWVEQGVGEVQPGTIPWRKASRQERPETAERALRTQYGGESFLARCTPPSTSKGVGLALVVVTFCGHLVAINLLITHRIVDDGNNFAM